MSLKGQTIFITGASRGIGLAIAVKCAADGANVAIAAKTAKPHPKLEGTIYTAAKAIEEAGGSALPLVCDIRFEDQIEAAVEATVARFGGIDIVVNNASAISLTGTMSTPLKRYDLMNQVNSRGTYAVTRACIPHLRKAHNPHVLTISPPLNMDQRWFQGHVAYTMAKYGMSMCVLGMSGEFEGDGIAFNALWPRTGIATAAVAMIGGGHGAFDTCRTPAIMADAAYQILIQDSTTCSGNFFIDDEILTPLGVDIEQYLCVPGTRKEQLMPDFFLDSMDVRPEGAIPASSRLMAPRGSAPAASAGSAAASPSSEEMFNMVAQRVQEQGSDLVRQVGAVIGFDVGGTTWVVDLKNGSGSVRKGSVDSANLTLTTDDATAVELMQGRTEPGLAWVQGKLKISGDMALASKVGGLFRGGPSARL